MMYIYKFEHNGECYVGSTKNYKMRCHAHNQHMKQARHNRTNFYQYCIENNIRDIRPFCEIIETIEDEEYDKDKLRIKEQEKINNLNPSLNMCRAVSRRKWRKHIKNI